MYSVSLSANVCIRTSIVVISWQNDQKYKSQGSLLALQLRICYISFDNSYKIM